MKKLTIFACGFSFALITASTASADIYSVCEDAVSRGDNAAVQEMASKIRVSGICGAADRTRT